MAISSSQKESVAQILQWRESVATLPDTHFFEIIRMYLGEVKTPYNKQKLIEELSSFLRREENKKVIISLLSEKDILLLTGVLRLPFPSQEKLSMFFSSEFTYVDLYETLLNLEERLLLYRYQEEKTGKWCFAINPLLKSEIEPLTKLSLLFPLPDTDESTFSTGFGTSYENTPCLSGNILAAWFSYIASYPDLCKTDGTFKKKTETHIAQIFPSFSNNDFFVKLTFALLNLGLVRQEENRYVLQVGKWRTFSSLSPQVQYAYIAAAACGRYPREINRRYSQLVCDIVASIPPEGFTKQILLRCGFLLQERPGQQTGVLRPSRFTSILQNYKESTISSTEGFSLSLLIDNMILFGILKKVGITNQQPIYIPSEGFLENKNDESGQTFQGSASINAGFTVTILGNIPLYHLIELVQWMNIVTFDSIGTYEITRSTVIRAFDNGITPSDIISLLKKTISHEVPQNLQFSLDEWYNSYNSASLFKGYVLKVSPDKQVLIENNPVLSEYIIMTLASGIYLLDFASEEEAEATIASSGLDFIGAVKKMRPDPEPLPFANVESSGGLQLDYNNASFERKADESLSVVQEMLSNLDAIEATKDQKEGLISRIQRKIVINKVQLRPDSVRPEKIEASGMDFLGKVHVVEQAIAYSSMVQIVCEFDDRLQEVVGLPIKIEKQQGDALLFIRLESEGKIIPVSIGICRSVKRIRGPIFKESHY
jgi:hypothetical protein